MHSLYYVYLSSGKLSIAVHNIATVYLQTEQLLRKVLRVKKDPYKTTCIIDKGRNNEAEMNAKMQLA